MVEIGYVEEGNIKSIVIDPLSTNLRNGEVQLWNFAAKTKGFFKIKAVISLVVTNCGKCGFSLQ